MTTDSITDTDSMLEVAAEQEMLAQEEKRAKHQIAMAEDLRVLQAMPEYQRLIESGFLDRNLKDNARMATRVSSNEGRETNSRVIFAIGYYQDWIDSVAMAGEQSSVQLEEIYQQQAELHQSI